MARPCGCAGECGCTILGVNGIAATGTGTVRDPKLIGLANPITGAGCDAIMGCVGTHAGAGLRYDTVSKNLAAKISGDAGNGLVFGTDNGLYAAGAGGGGDAAGATVASLPTADLIGGSYGAGFAQWPEGPIDTYDTAMEMGLKLIHVPVRRTAENYLVCQHYRTLGTYNYRYSGEVTSGMDLKMFKSMWYTPGGDPTLNLPYGDKSFQPQQGYFGHGYLDSRGTPRLSDVLRLTQRRTVLYLEVKDLGVSAGDTAAPIDTYTALQGEIRQFGVQKSVIVSSELSNNADRAGIVQGLQKLKNEDGVTIAAHIVSQAQADFNTPAKLTGEGFEWVFITLGIADTNPAAIQAYRDAGLHVMLHGGHRQWHFDLQRSVGARGILCMDPIYCAGRLSNFRYRKTVHSWNWGTADYGRYAYGTDFENMRDKYRGYVINGEPGAICIDGTTMGPHESDPNFRESGYFILMGEQCPVRDTRVPLNDYGAPNYYDLEVGFIWDGLTGDKERWMGIWFGRNTDRSVVEWTAATANSQGYEFQLSQNGTFTLQRYDGIAYAGSGDPFQFSQSWQSGWGQITPGTEYRVKVSVRPDRIILGPATQAEGGANTRVFTGTNGTMWRGPYFFLGKHFFNSADSTRCRFKNLQVTVGTSA